MLVTSCGAKWNMTGMCPFHMSLLTRRSGGDCDASCDTSNEDEPRCDIVTDERERDGRG